MFKRVALSLLTIGALAALVTASTLALFSAQTSNINNQFAAGTVALGSPSVTSISVGPLAPGDSGNAGKVEVEYQGNLQAWIGLDASISGDLVTCDGGKFTVELVHAAGTVGLNAVNPTAMNQVMGTAHNGDKITVDVNYNFDISAGNACQGADATVDLVIKAVQYRNNVNATGDGPISWS